MLHRIDDPLEQLGSSQFFSLAQRLPAYQGAVSAALMADRHQEDPGPDLSGLWADTPPAQREVRRVDDLGEVEALTNRDGFLGIEYLS